MTELPPKKELILRVELCSLQKEFYKAILSRNYPILTRRARPHVRFIFDELNFLKLHILDFNFIRMKMNVS